MFFLARWRETPTWAILSDLFIRPRRAWLRYRLRTLPIKIHAAYSAGQYDQVQQAAEKGLELVPQVGEHALKEEAIFFGRQFWGFVCAGRKQWDEAEFHLLESGKTKGSMWFKTTTPSFRLCQLLVEEGQIQPVVEYLRLFASWWAVDALYTKDSAEERRLLLKWKNKVLHGKWPDHPSWKPRPTP